MQDIWKPTERLTRLIKDDRFAGNREKLREMNLVGLKRIRDAVNDAIAEQDRMGA